MHIPFCIQYNNKSGESVETTSCVADSKEGREMLHKLLDEFIDNGFGEHAPKSDDDDVKAHFIVHGVPCTVHI
jgi:hypothetical protein